MWLDIMYIKAHTHTTLYLLYKPLNKTQLGQTSTILKFTNLSILKK